MMTWCGKENSTNKSKTINSWLRRRENLPQHFPLFTIFHFPHFRFPELRMTRPDLEVKRLHYVGEFSSCPENVRRPKTPAGALGAPPPFPGRLVKNVMASLCVDRFKRQFQRKGRENLENSGRDCCAPNRGARGRGDPTAPSTFSPSNALPSPTLRFSWSGVHWGSRGFRGFCLESEHNQWFVAPGDAVVRRRWSAIFSPRPAEIMTEIEIKRRRRVQSPRSRKCNLRKYSPIDFVSDKTEAAERKPLEGARCWVRWW